MRLLACITLLDLLTASCSAGGFITTPSFAPGYSPWFLAVGDFNGDGIPDLAITNNGEGEPNGSLSILLGNGDGSFRAPLNMAVEGLPWKFAVEDFNGDGRLDLAILTLAESGNNLKIFLGNGDGPFQSSGPNYPLGAGPVSLAVGDFNGDGIPDIAVADAEAPDPSEATQKSMVFVFFGNGDGTFRLAGTFEDGIGSNCIAVADFNGDGKGDIATHITIIRTIRVLEAPRSSRTTWACTSGTGTVRSNRHRPITSFKIQPRWW